MLAPTEWFIVNGECKRETNVRKDHQPLTPKERKIKEKLVMGIQKKERNNLRKPRTRV